MAFLHLSSMAAAMKLWDAPESSRAVAGAPPSSKGKCSKVLLGNACVIKPTSIASYYGLCPACLCLCLRALAACHCFRGDS